jgi:opacity protein-like surface antigen
MNKSKTITLIVSLFIGVGLFTTPVAAQGYGGALTFQGIDHYSLHSAGSRAMAGISIGMKQDPGLMFQNPATLNSLQRIQLSLGGLSFSTDSKQEQNYAPVRYYSNLSLLLEGLTDQIPDPPPDTSIFAFGTVMDTVQRPYDDIKPNWSRSHKNNLPLQAMLAVPVSLGNVKITAGIGAVEYADLDHYYQNNNGLSPDILTQRPLPTLRPTDDNPMEVDWFQSIRSREGQINGYGFALAAGVDKYNLSIGFSGMVLDGSTDDYEQQVGRGKLTFFSNAFRADSVSSIVTKTGTSKFSGQEYTLSSILTGRYLSIGIAVKIPRTITREYNMQVRTETDGISSSSTIQGKDKLELPWHGTIGLALTPRENLMISLEYESRPYNSVRYVDVGENETKPWLESSLFRVGAEYMIAPWLALRGGMRGQAEVFQAEGNQIEGEPVSYTVYTAGFGLFYSGLRLNVTYENSLMKYQDVWSSAISKNSEQRHVIIGQLSYEIPWIW